jgi:hypothetical protein
MTSIKLLNPQTQEQKEVPVGFSWTYFLFGFMVPLLRGDWRWAGISLAVSLITLGLGQVALCFFYNKLYIKGLVQEGFQALDAEGKQYLNQLSA